jgi:N-acylneuraminate cytidylyltransferase
MERSVAIITARGGSKRIPRKNIKEFLHKPIIAYSIAAALDARCFDEVMVSTDDREIADVARLCGAKIPFFRSAATSNDYATTADVLVEVLNEYLARDEEFAYACCIYPTAPFVTAEKLKRGHDLLRSTGADSAVPVVRFGYPIQRALKIEEGCLKMIWPEHQNSRSQDLMPAYHDCGQFYWIRTQSFLLQKRLFAEHTVPIEVPESEVQDIDTDEDWKIAEMKYRILMESRK